METEREFWKDEEKQSLMERFQKMQPEEFLKGKDLGGRGARN